MIDFSFIPLFKRSEDDTKAWAVSVIPFRFGFGYDNGYFAMGLIVLNLEIYVEFPVGKNEASN